MDPVLPFSATTLRKMLNLSGVKSSRPDEQREGSIGWEHAGSSLLDANHTLGRPEILFKKVDDEAIQMQIEKLQSAGGDKSQETSTPFVPLGSEIVYDDFAKLDLRMGTVVSAEKIPRSKKLLQLEVNLGFESRQILAGAAEHFEPAELVGRKVVIVANLAPRKMMGLESQGMVLMAEDRDGKLTLLSADGEAGAVVR